MATVVKFLKYIVLLVAYALVSILQSQPQTWTLDDFEDGNLKSASGLSWIVIADDLGGGATEARLELTPGGRSPSRQALRLAGRLGGGPVSFAGAWAPLERTGRNLDLSAFEGVRLRVKGPARLDVGFRSGVVNFMTRVDAGPDWNLIEIPFTQLAATGPAPEGTRWNPRAVQIFGVTTPQTSTGDNQATGEFAFEIDDVEFYGQGTDRLVPVASGPPTGYGVVPFTTLSAIPSTGWVELGTDPERDGKMPSLPDAIRLEAIPSAPGDMLWTRITLRETPHERWMGVNLAFDVDGDPSNGAAWWGSNSAFKFDRLVTVWCVRVADGCQGYIGLADADQVAARTMVAGGGAQLRFAIDRERRAFVVGVPRALLTLQGKEIRLVAAVGSALLYADDVPGQGAATIR
ncbi:MAG: CIA30 family protein [Acidobacteriota bacterium]